MITTKNKPQPNTNLNKDLELHKAGRTCCMCFETKGIYTLKELIEDKENNFGVINQAKILLKFHGYKESDKFCEDCFWK